MGLSQSALAFFVIARGSIIFRLPNLYPVTRQIWNHFSYVYFQKKALQRHIHSKLNGQWIFYDGERRNITNY